MLKLSKSLLAGLLVLAPLVATGCGGSNGSGGGLLGGGGILGQRSAWGGGGIGGVNTPVLGGGPRSPSTQPPTLTQQNLPSAPAQFDSNIQAVLQKYNAQIGGPWATPEYVAYVVQCMQLYPAVRTHPLRITVGPDDSMPGISGLWTSEGDSANIYFYDPSVISTPAHELAHDQTLMTQPNEGNGLRQLYGISDSAFVRGYSQTDDREFAADALSFWARKVAKLGDDVDYDPPAEVIRAIQPLLVPALRTMS